ncbi:unnamed protein product [Ambrosiozyma monospora]|uniref:Unnamed protein product n=1 Tax=Ambrosiozyma monospora TaxID=43982 RepID=A0A9W7DIN6_AMBMO|nr:unnamed protein product [Ambrosiozyma monospora]
MEGPPTLVSTTAVPLDKAAKKSAWLVKRLLLEFTDAIIEQSNEATGGSYNRAKSLISYCVSPFAFYCMLTATILNRILIFASSNKKLPTVSKVLLRLISIYLLIEGAYGVLVSIKVYSDNALIQKVLSGYYDFDPESFKNYTFLGLHYSSSYFENQGPTPTIFRAFYLALCCSQIMETFIAVTNGSDPHVENGLTLFEYSLAFQEVQYAKKPSYELLVISTSALLGQLNVHVLGLLNLQNYRLIPSFIIGLFSLLFYFKVFVSGKIFQIPITIIVGYFPQLIC